MSEISGPPFHRVALSTDITSVFDDLVSSPISAETPQGQHPLAPSPRPCRYRLSHYIAQRLAQNDYAAVASALQLLPLKFRSAEYETGFFQRLSATQAVRTNTVTWVALSIALIFWIVGGISIHFDIYETANTTARWLFHIIMGSLCFAVLVFWTLGFSQRVHFYPEVLLYSIAAVIGPGALVWVIYNTALFPAESPMHVLYMDQFKLWTAPLYLGIPLWNSLLVNLLMQTRTRRSFLPQIGILMFHATAALVAAFLLMMKQDQAYAELAHQRLFYLIVTVLELMSLIGVFCMCYFGRWNLELQERIEFWKFLKSTTQLRELKSMQQKHRKTCGSTAVEDLLHIITRAAADIHEAEVTTGSATLVECSETLRQIQHVLTNSNNLYAVKLRGVSTATAYEMDIETAQLEAKFYEIYDTKTPAPLSSPAIHKKTSSVSGGRSNIFKVRNLAPAPQASAEFRRAVGRDWNCNILQASKLYTSIVVEVAALLLEPRSQDLDVSPLCIRNFAYGIERLYRPNPYHNSTHAAMVAHSMSCLLRMLDINQAHEFTALDYTATIIAALGHDTGHPGRNNNFYVNTFERLALLYNDRSVLENFHTALVFKSMEPRSCGVFSSLSHDIAQDLRRKMIDLILATDMSLHFEAVSKFRLRRQAPGFNYFEDADDLWLVIRMCMKCADLSHALVDWTQHQEWSLRVTEEFYQQGEDESALGLLKSPLCDRSQHYDFADSQKGFIEFVVQPLFTQMENIDIGDRIVNSCLKHLTFNKYKWEEMAREKRTVEIPADVQGLITDAGSHRPLLLHLLVPHHYRLLPENDPVVMKHYNERCPTLTAFSADETLMTPQSADAAYEGGSEEEDVIDDSNSDDTYSNDDPEVLSVSSPTGSPLMPPYSIDGRSSTIATATFGEESFDGSVLSSSDAAAHYTHSSKTTEKDSIGNGSDDVGRGVVQHDHTFSKSQFPLLTTRDAATDVATDPHFWSDDSLGPSPRQQPPCSRADLQPTRLPPPPQPEAPSPPPSPPSTPDSSREFDRRLLPSTTITRQHRPPHDDTACTLTAALLRHRLRNFKTTHKPSSTNSVVSFTSPMSPVFGAAASPRILRFRNHSPFQNHFVSNSEFAKKLESPVVDT